MSDKRYFGHHRLIQQLFSTKWLTPFTINAMHHFDRMMFKLSGGRYTMTSIFAGLPLVMVHTIGAKSGLKRSIPLICIRENPDDTEFAIIASNYGQDKLPSWYYNLKANPQVECTIQGVTKTYLSTEADGEDYRHYWSIAEKIYIGYPKYKQRTVRHIPIMIMIPTHP